MKIYQINLFYNVEQKIVQNTLLYKTINYELLSAIHLGNVLADLYFCNHISNFCCVRVLL